MTESPTPEPQALSPTARIASAGVWVITAAVLFWVGLVLPADSAEAMDGVQRLIFTVIPIRPFAWIMAVVFLGLAVRVVVSKDAPPGEAER